MTLLDDSDTLDREILRNRRTGSTWTTTVDTDRPRRTEDRRNRNTVHEHAQRRAGNAPIDAAANNYGQIWTEADLAVALDRRIPTRDAARRLGRTVNGVESVRRNIRDRQRRTDYWTAEQLAIIADPTLTNRQAADRVGRTVKAVEVRRYKLRKGR